MGGSEWGSAAHLTQCTVQPAFDVIEHRRDLARAKHGNERDHDGRDPGGKRRRMRGVAPPDLSLSGRLSASRRGVKGARQAGVADEAGKIVDASPRSEPVHIEHARDSSAGPNDEIPAVQVAVGGHDR